MLKYLFLLSAYTVYVKTSGDEMMTGTDANVWIKIHGDKGVNRAIKLANGQNTFEQGQQVFIAPF